MVSMATDGCGVRSASLTSWNHGLALNEEESTIRLNIYFERKRLIGFTRRRGGERGLSGSLTIGASARGKSGSRSESGTRWRQKIRKGRRNPDCLGLTLTVGMLVKPFWTRKKG